MSDSTLSQKVTQLRVQLIENGVARCESSVFDEFMLRCPDVQPDGTFNVVKNATVIKYNVTYRRIAPSVLSVCLVQK